MGFGLWFVCGCEGVGVLWGFFLVCEGVRVCVCLCWCGFFSLCVFCLPSLWLVWVPLFECVLRFRFCCVFLCGFLCFNGFPFAVLKIPYVNVDRAVGHIVNFMAVASLGMSRMTCSGSSAGQRGSWSLESGPSCWSAR